MFLFFAAFNLGNSPAESAQFNLIEGRGIFGGTFTPNFRATLSTGNFSTNPGAGTFAVLFDTDKMVGNTKGFRMHFRKRKVGKEVWVSSETSTFWASLIAAAMALMTASLAGR